jgi:hypothetical protein
MKIVRFLFVVLCFRVWGQVPNERDSVPEPTPTPVPPAYDVLMSFYTWPVRGVMHGGMEIPSIPPVVLRSDSGAVQLPLQRNAQTEAYRYVGHAAPVLATPVSMTVDEEGNRQYQFETVAELEIPREWGQVVVILFPEERNAKGRWRNIVVPASNVLVPDGKLRVINTTRQGLVLEINENYAALYTQIFLDTSFGQKVPLEWCMGREIMRRVATAPRIDVDFNPRFRCKRRGSVA